MDTVAIWLSVALLHVIAAWILARPIAFDLRDAGASLQVVFIQRLDVSPRSVAKTVSGVAGQRSSAEPQSRRPRPQGRVEQAVTSLTPALVVGDDAWDRVAAKPPDGILFAHQPLTSTYSPRPRPAPGRFRMQRELSPEDVVRGVSQVLGFWPPGYTDDPCAGLDKAVEMFTDGRTSRERGLLADALRERAKYCK